MVPAAGHKTLHDAHVDAKANILSMQKIRDLHKGHSNSHELCKIIRDRYELYYANINDIVKAGDDKTIIAQSDNQKLTL